MNYASGRRGSENRARQHQTLVRFSDEEWIRVLSGSKAAKISVASYIRESALKRELPAYFQIILELRSLAELQRQIYHSSAHADSPELAKVIAAILGAIEQLAAKTARDS